MSNELSTEISPEIINSLILTGDMSKLTPAQQTQYYNAICNMLGISPLTQPFAIIVYQGKKTMYARKDCAQQLCNTRKISTEVKKTEKESDIYITYVRASMPDGRFADDIGAVAISGVKGQDLANLYMKSSTKAKRRAVLALCGLGMPDETEVEDFTNQKQSVDTSKSRVEQIIDTQIEEVKDVKKEETPKEVKKTTKEKPKVVSVVNEQKLPEGHKTIQGIITDTPTYAEIGSEKKPKWVFKIGELKLGTFDKSVFEGITSIMDLQGDKPILLNIEYKERISGEKTLRDIVKFSQVTASQVPI
jgi:hypothetical protein